MNSFQRNRSLILNKNWFQFMWRQQLTNCPFRMSYRNSVIFPYITLECMFLWWPGQMLVLLESFHLPAIFGLSLTLICNEMSQWGGQRNKMLNSLKKLQKHFFEKYKSSSEMELRNCLIWQKQWNKMVNIVH